MNPNIVINTSTFICRCDSYFGNLILTASLLRGLLTNLFHAMYFSIVVRPHQDGYDLLFNIPYIRYYILFMDFLLDYWLL